MPNFVISVVGNCHPDPGSFTPRVSVEKSKHSCSALGAVPDGFSILQVRAASGSRTQPKLQRLILSARA
jgi:hypothetical protein